MATRSTTRRRASCLVSGRSLGSTSRRESSSWAAQRRGSSASEVLIRVAGWSASDDDTGDRPSRWRSASGE